MVYCPIARVDWVIGVGAVPGEIVETRRIPLVQGEKGYWRFTEEGIANASRLHELLFPEEYLLRTIFEDL